MDTTVPKNLQQTTLTTTTTDSPSPNLPSSFTLSKLPTQDDSDSSIDRTPTRKRLRSSKKNLYFSSIPSPAMGSTPATKRNDAMANIQSPISNKKSIANSKGKEPSTAKDSTTTSNPNLDYVHAQTPEWMLSMTSEIREIQAQLTTVLNQNKILDQRVNSFSETELLLQQARLDLEHAHKEIQQLKDQLARASSASHASPPAPLVSPVPPSLEMEYMDEETDFPALPSTIPPPSLGISHSKWAQGKPSVTGNQKAPFTPPRSRKRLNPRKVAAFARTFTLPSSTQGFQFLYLPTQRKYSIKEMRQRLHGLGIDKSRIIHIHYPDSNIVAILIHNDYASTAITQLASHDIQPTLDFNPLSHTILRDPQYKDLDIPSRTSILKDLHYKRSNTIISHLRYPLNVAVAREFASQKWILDSDLTTLVDSYKKKPSTQILIASQSTSDGMEDDTEMINISPSVSPVTNNMSLTATGKAAISN